MQFVKLCSRSWSLRALQLIETGVPARISPVAHAAGSGRTAMTASFRHLKEMGMLERAEGHGHPLRPEFVLTAQGQDVGRWAVELALLFDGETDWQTARLTWSLPIMLSLIETPRFGHLSLALKPITDRALAQTLVRLEAADWLERIVDASARPPAVIYLPSRKGEMIAHHCRKLCNDSQDIDQNLHIAHEAGAD